MAVLDQDVAPNEPKRAAIQLIVYPFMLFEADIGHAFDFQECIRAFAAVAGVVADFEVVKVLARASAKDDVFGMPLCTAPEDRGPERRKSAPLERDVADAPVGRVALRFNREVAFADVAVLYADALDAAAFRAGNPRGMEPDSVRGLADAATADGDVADRSRTDAYADADTAAGKVAVLDDHVFAGVLRRVELAAGTDGDGADIVATAFPATSRACWMAAAFCAAELSSAAP